MKSPADLLSAALELSREQRAELVARLIESLDDAPEESPEVVAAAWDEELERRCREVDEGRAVLVPWETVREQLRGRR